MQTIGERLEEARKRKGISLREAAEGTKIRSDFLSNIEQNKFDFELPEIYKRGFIKNYARYLKLDPDKIITDYSAQILGNTRGKKGANEWFGSMEIKPNEQEVSGKSDEGPSYGRISAKPAKTGSRSESNAEEEEDSDEGDKMFYLKAGLIFLGTIALVFVIFGLVRAILGSSDKDAVEPQQSQTTAIEAPATPATATPAGTNEFKLIASGTVFAAARQLNDRKMLYQGTLSAGEEVALQKDGPVEIVFTAAENISVQFNGETIRPDAANTTGSSKIKLP